MIKANKACKGLKEIQVKKGIEVIVAIKDRRVIKEKQAPGLLVKSLYYIIITRKEITFLWTVKCTSHKVVFKHNCTLKTTPLIGLFLVLRKDQRVIKVIKVLKAIKAIQAIRVYKGCQASEETKAHRVYKALQETKAYRVLKGTKVFRG